MGGGVRRDEDRESTLKAYHQAGNWFMALNCTNAFNHIKCEAVLGEVAAHIPGLAPSDGRC